MTNNILESEKSLEDLEEKGIRPLFLTDFIGQNDLKSNLNIFINAAKKRKETLDHVILYGPPGLGKTTLAQIIANEVGTNIKITSAPILTKAGDIAAILTNLEAGDILFIDEIHRLNVAVEEILYSVMEDFKIDIMVGEGATARSVRIELPKFTLIGATTRYGLISNPLKDRFGIDLQFDFYTDKDLVKIVMRTASIINLEINTDSAFEIAKRSRGTPRVANRLLKRVRDFFTVSKEQTVSKSLVNYSLQELGIDEKGLDKNDIRYLTSIAKMYSGGPVGIDTIAALLSEQKDTIEDTIESYLIKTGFIQKTPRGRVLTDLALRHIGMESIKHGK